MKIIDELINELTDKNIFLTDILVKTKVLAFKLKNKELSKWIDNELNGYYSEKIPTYRVLPCQIIGNISNGFQRAKNFPIPLLGINDKLKKGMLTVQLNQSISTLDEFVKGGNGDKLIMNIPPEMYGYLSKELDNGFAIEYARRELGKIQIIQTLTSVRTKLLDFLLNINEEIGDIDDIKPLTQEALKEKVASTFHSSVFGDNTTIIIGDNNTQTVTITKGNFEELEKNLIENGVDNKDIQELQEIINNDSPNEKTKEFGNNVKKWISGMLYKTMEGSWKIGLGTAGNVLSKGIKMYYGWE